MGLCRPPTLPKSPKWGSENPVQISVRLVQLKEIGENGQENTFENSLAGCEMMPPNPQIGDRRLNEVCVVIERPYHHYQGGDLVMLYSCRTLTKIVLQQGASRSTWPESSRRMRTILKSTWAKIKIKEWSSQSRHSLLCVHYWRHGLRRCPLNDWPSLDGFDSMRLTNDWLGQEPPPFGKQTVASSVYWHH